MARGLEEGEITVNKFKTIGILPAKLSLALLSFLPCRSNKIPTEIDLDSNRVGQQNQSVDSNLAPCAVCSGHSH